MKVAVIAKAEQIELERFTLHQFAIGNIGNAEGGKIGLAGNRANAGEFRADEGNEIVVIGMFVGERLKYFGRVSVRHGRIVIAEQGNACGRFGFCHGIS